MLRKGAKDARRVRLERGVGQERVKGLAVSTVLALLLVRERARRRARSACEAVPRMNWSLPGENERVLAERRAAFGT
eukprot:5773076-Pleurochrysis_carterae.AAC.2